MVWTIDIMGPNGGADIVTAAPYKSLVVSWTVEGPGAIEIDLTETQLSSNWAPGVHRVRLNGDHDWGGYITRFSKEGLPDQETWRASGQGLESILDWRIVRHATTLMDYEVSDMVQWLLNEAQTQYNGNMDFTMGNVYNGTTATRTRNYCFGVVIGDAIRELASTGRGFDWSISPNGTLNIWNITRGTATGIHFHPENFQEYSVDYDTSALVTTVSAVGDPSQPYGPIHDMVRDINAANTFGRHEVVIDVDSTDRQELLDAAAAELKVSRGGFLQVTAMWASDRAPWSLGTVWLQDRVHMHLPAYFGVDVPTLMRCTGITVTLDVESPTVYWVEQTFDAHVTDAELATDDPSAPQAAIAAPRVRNQPTIASGININPAQQALPSTISRPASFPALTLTSGASKTTSVVTASSTVPAVVITKDSADPYPNVVAATTTVPTITVTIA